MNFSYIPKRWKRFTMKILILLSLITLIACEAPQRTRLSSAYESMTSPYKGGDQKTDKDTTPGDFGEEKQAGPIDSEYAHCDYSYRHHTLDIGHFAICQSRSDETKFKFKTQMANRNVQVCLIPTYRDSSGGSTYLGNPQCLYTDAGKDYEGRLYKDRNGFSGYTINGVIVLKYGLHSAYYSCMNASLNWPVNVCPNPNSSQTCWQYYANCPNGAATNGNCAALANNHMRQVCESFKSTYSRSYADISTR